MSKITDDDLTLLYYGEHDDPSLATRVAASPELTERFDALVNELGQVEALAPPERGDDYGADVWRRIAPRLAEEPAQPRARWKNLLAGLSQPRFSLAGALSLVLVAALAFMLGRQGAGPAESTVVGQDAVSIAAKAQMDGGRLLTSSVSGHLDQVNLFFTQFANSSEASGDEAELATDMLVANRLYRRAAANSGNQKLASVLAEIEPLLIEMAHDAHNNSPATRDRLQQEVRDNLLFRVRFMNRRLEQPNLST